MKKLFLVAALGVAGLMSASNIIERTEYSCQESKVESPEQVCGVEITYFDSNGYVTDVKTFYSVDMPNYMACYIWQQTVLSSNGAADYERIF